MPNNSQRLASLVYEDSKLELAEKRSRLRNEIASRELVLSVCDLVASRFGFALRRVVEVMQKMEQEPKMPVPEWLLPLVLFLTAEVFLGLTTIDVAALKSHRAVLDDLRSSLDSDLLATSWKIPPIPLELNEDAETNYRRAIQFFLRSLGSPAAAADFDSFSGLKKSDPTTTTACEPCWISDDQRAAGARLRESYVGLGNYLVANGRFTKATQHYQEGVTLFKSTGDSIAICQMQYNLAALILRSLGLSSASQPSDMEEKLKSGTLSFCFFLELVAFLWCLLDFSFGVAKDFLETVVKSDLLKSEDPRTWSDAQCQLGNTHMLLASRQERQGNLEETAASLKKALAAYSVVQSAPELGDCHYKIATFYVRSAQNEANKTMARTKKDIALSHFEKAATSFSPQEQPLKFVTVHLDQVRLCKALFFGGKTENFENALLHLLALEPLFSEAASQQARSISGELWTLVKTELQAVLKELLKLYSPQTGQHLRTAYLKELYRLSLSEGATEFFRQALPLQQHQLE